MQADDQPTPEPKADAAEPVGPAAELLDPAAARLNPVAERLPAARWPVQDLHNCDRSYVEHVHAEMRKLGGAAAGLAFVGGGLALLALVWGLPIGEGVKRSLAGLLGVEIILTFGASFNFLVKFGEASLAHPGGEHAPGSAARRRIRVGTYVFGFGFFIAFALFVVAFMYSTPVAVALAIVAVSFACVGTFIAVRAMGVYSQLTLGRLGGDARPLILERPPALLALAGVPVVPLAAFDAVPWPWAAAPTLGGLAVLAGGAALHANRARRALGRLLPKDEAAP
mgnify:CR=1 FL=1